MNAILRCRGTLTRFHNTNHDFGAHGTLKHFPDQTGNTRMEKAKSKGLHTARQGLRGARIAEQVAHKLKTGSFTPVDAK